MNIADPSFAAWATKRSVVDRQALPSGPAAADGAAVLAGCPVPVAGIDADGLLRWANAACQALLPGLRSGVPLTAQCGFDSRSAEHLARALAAPGGGMRAIGDLRAGEHRLQARVQALGGGCVVWLTPVERPQRTAAHVESERLHELLDLACSLGRLGLWKRDLVTGQGWWDERVFRTRGLEGTPGAAPDFDDAAGGIVASDLPAFEAAMRQSLQPPVGDDPRPPWRIRYRIRGDDGVVRALHKQWFVERGPDGEPLRMVGLVTDDSEAMALMRTRDETVSQLALAADLTGFAVWRHDLASGSLTFGKQTFAVFDIDPTPDDIPIGLLRARFHPADRDRAEAWVQEVLHGGGPPADDELRLQRRDGRWRTLVVRRAVQRDGAGQALAIVGVAIDVTERIVADRRAAELGRRFELAIGVAGIGHWSFDARSRKARWSAPLCRMHGLPADAPVPGLRRWLAAFVDPADRALVRRRISAWRRADRRAGVRLDIDLRIRHADGEVRELLVQVVVEDEGFDGGNLFGLVLDVTERRSAEAARRDRARALQESEAKSRFLSRMNHELRTPLNAVIGFAQLLRDEDDASDPAAAKRAQRIAHIRSAGLHLLELINDSLDLSSLEGGETPLLRKPVDLGVLVAETLPLVEALCVERGVVVDPAGVAEGVALADPTRLRQVLLNLVSNAVKYNRCGGTLRVDASVSGETAVLRVTDTGRGMTAQQLRHLFEPFNRLGAEAEGIEGSGIGLTIVKSLTERMGGSVHVESEAGVGSVFELRLAAATKGPRRPGAGRDAAPRSLLYVEDDPVNTLIMSEVLARRRNLVVHLADHGAEGLEMARRLQPGLILLDMQLPDIDGLEVLTRLRADPATAAIPVVGLSANALRDDVERARAAGIDAYWPKPIDHAAFLAALDAMFDLVPTASGRERAP